jgi:hypothetical protein
MGTLKIVTEDELYRFFACQNSIFKEYSTMRKNLTNAVKERPQLLKALQLESSRTINILTLSQNDAIYLMDALCGIWIEGFYSKSIDLCHLDNLNIRPSYLVTLENGKTFMCKRPEGAFQHQKLSDKAQQLPLKTIFESIDQTIKQTEFIDAFKLMMEIVGENTTYSDAIVFLSNIENKEICALGNKNFITAGKIITFASRVRTTINGYLRENWDMKESRVAMAYSDLSVMLHSTETFKVLIKTRGFLIEDTQKTKDSIWGFSSDAKSEQQILDGRNYLGLVHTIFRNFFLFKRLTESTSSKDREKLFNSMFGMMHIFIPMMIELIDNVVKDSQ